MQSPPAAWTVVRLRQAARKTVTHQDAGPKITVAEPASVKVCSITHLAILKDSFAAIPVFSNAMLVRN